MDLWGENVLAVGHNGVIYEYEPGAAKFLPVANAPTATSLVVDDNRRVFALGANDIPNRLSWSTQEDNTVWTAAVNNTAGGFILNTQSQLICGARGRGLTFIWSETDLFGIFPTYNALVYGQERLGANCGAVSQNAAVVVGEVAYWMGRDGFYMFNGQVQRLECDIHDFVFGKADSGSSSDFNALQRAKVHVRHNTMFDEIWFCYPSGENTENNRVAIFNYRTNTWTKANLARTAWCDRGAFDFPMGLAPDGKIYRHEFGSSDNGLPMGSYVQSAPFELGNGDQIQHVRSFWPDARMNLGSGLLLLTLKNAPHGPGFTAGPFPFSQSTQRINLAKAGRQLALRLMAGSPGDHWEVGEPRVELTAGGGR
jgi:hypothetical protein